MTTTSIPLRTAEPLVQVGDIFEAPTRERCAIYSDATDVDGLPWGHMVLVLGQVAHCPEYWRVMTVSVY
jgi:hypothetical protein